MSRTPFEVRVRLSATLALASAAALAASCRESPPAEPEPEGCAAIRVTPAAHPIPGTLLAARREAALARIGRGVALVAAGWDMAQAEGDPERQNSAFYYLTGLEHVERGWLALIARDGGADEVRLYLPVEDAVAGGVPATAAAGVGGDGVRCFSDAPAELEAVLVRDATVADGDLYLNPNGELAQFVDGELGIGQWEQVRQLVMPLRAVKDSAEVSLLRDAATITAEAIALAMEATEPGLNERDIEAVIERAFTDAGAVRRAFPSIVASGEHALEPHYFTNDGPLAAGELVVVDVGVEYGRYAGDVARTWPVSGEFTERQTALYGLVLAALRDGIAAVQPGNTMADVDVAIAARLDATDLCAGGCAAFMSHGPGHGVGLDVHDDPIYPAFSPGAVVNVEPGIYLAAENIGLRLEETVLVTPTGHEVLSVGAPLELEDIEALMAD